MLFPGSLSTLLAALISSLALLNRGDTAQLSEHKRAKTARSPEVQHDNQILIFPFENDQNSRESRREIEPFGRSEPPNLSKQSGNLLAGSVLYEDRFDQQAPTAEALMAAAGSGIEMGNASASSLGPASEEQHESGLASLLPEPLSNSLSSALISATTMTSLPNDSVATYATINYNGLIAVNATDPFSITSESRSEFTLPTEVQILMCFFYGTLAFTAIASNMIVCYIVLSNQRMRTATNYFIVNLAMGDIMMALLCIPFTFPANLIFQYWPFGLSLCVIVSYSQANSVFISAYTMVAISIDKYIAIMYPMRLRMPKNQAKIIILAIWSAALLTSLPTALLSSLTPADTAPPQPTSTAPAQALTSTTLKAKPDTTDSVSAVLWNDFLGGTITPAIVSSEINLSSRSHEDNSERESSRTTPAMNDDERRQEKLLASSSDNSSETIPRGRASSQTSSTASLPIHSSTTSPTRTMSKEQRDYEENMRYFCQESWNFWPPGKKYYSMALMILQFALPLFVLVITYTRIVIVVWGKRMPGEEDNARDARMARSKRKMIKMVIFCVIAFALTWLPFNALILIGDVHPVIWEHNNITYIWFITHYLAMCHTITNPLIYIWMNNRFRAGFKQVIGDMWRWLRRAVAFLLCYCLCLGCCFRCTRQKYARLALEINQKRNRRPQGTSSGSANPHNNTNSNYLNQNYMTASANVTTTHHHSGSSVAVGRTNNQKGDRTNWTGAEESHDSRPVGVELSAGIHSSYLDKCHDQVDTENRPEVAPASEPRIANRTSSNEDPPSPPISPPQVVQVQSNVMSHEPVHGHQLARSEPSDPVGLESNSHQLRRMKQFRVFGRFRSDGEHRANALAKTTLGQKCANSNLEDPQSLKPTERPPNIGPRAGARPKHRRKRTHAISLQMTTCEFYGSNQNRAKQKESCHMGAATSGETGKWRIRRSKASGKTKSSGTSGCATCRLSTGAGLTSASSPQATRSGDLPQKRKLDLNSKYYVVDLRQSSQSTATISAQTNNTSLAISSLNSNRRSRNESGDNNTSNSLSAIGNVTNGHEGAQEPAATSTDQSNGRPLVKRQQHETLLTSGHELAQDEPSLVANGDSSNRGRHNDSLDESSGSRVCLSLKLDGEKAKRAAGDSGGTLSGATSLEGHQLASSRSTPSHEDDSDRRRETQTLNELVPAADDAFCTQHRQTSSVCEHRHLSALSSDEQDYLETGDEEELEEANAQFVNNSETGANQEADVTAARRRLLPPDVKSSSTFELVSDQLLLGRGQGEYSNHKDTRPDHCTISIMEPHNGLAAGARQSARLKSPAGEENISSGDSELDEADEEANLVAEYGDSASETMQMRQINGPRRRRPRNGFSGNQTRLLMAGHRLHSSQPESEWCRPAASAMKQIARSTCDARAPLLRQHSLLKLAAGNGTESASILANLGANSSRRSIANYH